MKYIITKKRRYHYSINDNDELGYITASKLVSPANTIEIGTFYVTDCLRSNGKFYRHKYGKDLLANLVAEANDNNIEFIIVHPAYPGFGSNIPSEKRIEIYKKLGFREPIPSDPKPITERYLVYEVKKNG